MWASYTANYSVVHHRPSDVSEQFTVRILCCTSFYILQAGIGSEIEKRVLSVPNYLQNCVLDRFLTSASDVCADGNSDNGKQSLRVDMFFPVLDTVKVSLDSRFNPECVSVIANISSILRFDDDFESAAKTLCAIAKLDAESCVTDAKQMMAASADYKSFTSLHSLSLKMIERQHSLVYKHFFNLVTYLLTLPVTSATCERAHSKVDLIKSAIRARMGSDRLEDLVIVSSEKHILDNLDLFAVVDRFALHNRALPL